MFRSKFSFFVGAALILLSGPLIGLFLVNSGLINGAPSESKLIANAHAAVTARLRDPSSAQFRSNVVLGTGIERTVCGTVNAKNGFGGYTGYYPFIYSEQTKRPRISSSESEATDVLQDCRQAKINEIEGEIARLEKVIKAQEKK